MAASKVWKRGQMTVAEAGRLGGERTRDTHGPEFYEEIGRKGGEKAARLLARGKELERGDAAAE